MRLRIAFVLALAVAGVLASALPADAAAPRTVTAELTGYSYFDNTPPSSARICCPRIHARAGGTGTYSDPITTAVPGSGSRMQTAAGTRLYVPSLRRYFVVEDSGASYQGDSRRFDVWVDGRGHPERSSERCMRELTGRTEVIINPRPGHPVTRGPLTGRPGCRI